MRDENQLSICNDKNAMYLALSKDSDFNYEDFHENINELSVDIARYAKFETKSENLESLEKNSWIFSELKSKMTDSNTKRYYLAGKLNGARNIFREIITLQNENNEKEQTLVNITRIKHFSDFLSLLYSRNTLTFQEIQSELNFNKKSAVSNFLSRISKYDIFISVSSGRNRYYHITPHGRKIYHTFCVEKNNKLTSDDYNDFIILLIRAMTESIDEEKSSIQSMAKKIFQEADAEYKHITKPKLIEIELLKFLEKAENKKNNSIRWKQFDYQWYVESPNKLQIGLNNW